MPKIAFHCPHCKKFAELEMEKGNFSCPNCAKHLGKLLSYEEVFKNCPVCGCRQFYLSKNFNQMMGCGVVLLGIIFVPWTFGLSLPVFALIDWLLYRRVKTIANCYKCGCEFHDFSYPGKLKPFLHHIGLKYDKFRS